MIRNNKKEDGKRGLPAVSLLFCTLLIFVMFLAGCVAHRPHRTPVDGKPAGPINTSIQALQEKKHRKQVEKSSIERHKETIAIKLNRDLVDNAPKYIKDTFRGLAREIKQKEVSVKVEYTVAAVEFDDHGEFWSRDQYEQVIADIKDKYKNNDAVQMVAFANGWKHSAALCDEYLSCFRTMLAFLAAIEETSDESKKRPVYGVYVGWRGGSMKIPVLKNFTYWERKNTAHRVGTGDVVELFATLDALHRDKRGGPDVNNKLTRLTIMGHSMGGAIVFSAIANTLEERLARFLALGNPEPRGLITGFGTLAILINPAIEACQYQGINEMLKRCCERRIFRKDNPRVLVTVASEKDCPNRKIFPIGQSIGTLFQNTRSDRQQKQMITTIGHYGPFMTHELELHGPGARPANKKGNAKKCSCASRNAIQEAVAEANTNIKRMIRRVREIKQDVKNFIRTAKAEALEEMYGRTKLVKKKNRPAADSPFIVVEADRRVIGGHGDIWSLPFMEFVAQLIARNDQQIIENDKYPEIKEKIY